MTSTRMSRGDRRQPGRGTAPCAGRAAAIGLGLCLFLASGRAGAQTLPKVVIPRPDRPEIHLDLKLPTPDRVWRLESEAVLKERMVREARQAPKPYTIAFPKEPVLSGPPYPGRDWAPLVEVIEPGYVCYGRLYFEQISSERYGWDFGCLHPLLSAGIFYFDVLTLPYHLGTEPCRHYECNAGYPLPGDPVPLRCYGPKLSLTGALTEAATIGLLAVIFP